MPGVAVRSLEVDVFERRYRVQLQDGKVISVSARIFRGVRAACAADLLAPRVDRGAACTWPFSAGGYRGGDDCHQLPGAGGMCSGLSGTRRCPQDVARPALRTPARAR